MCAVSCHVTCIYEHLPSLSISQTLAPQASPESPPPTTTAPKSDGNEGLTCSYSAAIPGSSSSFLPSLPHLSSSCSHIRPSRPCSRRRGNHSSPPPVSETLLPGFNARSAHIKRCSSDEMRSSPKWGPHLATLLCSSYSSLLL